MAWTDRIENVRGMTFNEVGVTFKEADTIFNGLLFRNRPETSSIWNDRVESSDVWTDRT